MSDEEADPFSQYSNFEASDNDVPGMVVYEGSNDYYIGEDNMGCFIFEAYSGWPSEGDHLYGSLNRFGFRWVINPQLETEYKIYIEEYALTREQAIDWMRERNHIKDY